MERLAILFVDRIFAEEEISFNDMDSAKDMSSDGSEQKPKSMPSVSNMVSGLDLNCSLKSSFYHKKLHVLLDAKENDAFETSSTTKIFD